MPGAVPRAFRASRAFLVRAADIGESDRRLTFFTESEGLLTVVAKSAWKSRKRFGGALQRYLLLEISWTERPGRMPVLTSARILASFWEIVESWERVRHADYALELCAALFPQPGAKPRAFESLEAVLRGLARGEPPPSSARKAEAAFLAIGGWGPNLSGCRTCGAADARKYRFVASEGRIYCLSCLPKGGFPLSLGAVKTWRALQAAPPARLGTLRLAAEITLELQNVIPGYLEWNLGRTFRSLGGESRSGSR